MSRPLPWVRLERDFHSEAAILEVCDTYPAAEVLAAYAIALTEAARSGGSYASAASVERSLRRVARLKPQRARDIVAAFISSGILTESDGALRLAAWEDLKPKDRHISKAQRDAQTATDAVAPATQDDAPSVEDHERTDGHNTTPHDAATEPKWLDKDTVLLPPKVEPIRRTVCSHGERFEERPGKDGRLFWSAGHRVDGAAWCGEKP